MAKRRETLWRFVKVIYFLVTIPAIALLIFLVKDNYVISRRIAEDDRYQVMNYWSFFAVIILIVIGYILLTDGLRKLIGYISSGKFEDGISYKKLFLKFRYVIIAGVLVWCGLFSFGRYYEHQIRNYCREEGAILSKEGDCSCDETAEMVDGKCQIKDEIKENQILSGLIAEYLETNDFFPVFYSFIDGVKEKKVAFVIAKVDERSIPDKFFNVFSDEVLESFKLEKINNYLSFDKNCNRIKDKEINGIDGFVGKWYFFTFLKKDQKREIDFISQIPRQYSSSILRYPEYIHRYDYFNWKDVDGDWRYNEFFLQNCHGKYLLVGYDDEKNRIFYYPFVEDSDNIDLWRDFSKNPEISFINWKYHHQTSCNFKLGIVAYAAWDWIYNADKRIFEMKNYIFNSCVSDQNWITKNR